MRLVRLEFECNGERKGLYTGRHWSYHKLNQSEILILDSFLDITEWVEYENLTDNDLFYFREDVFKQHLDAIPILLKAMYPTRSLVVIIVDIDNNDERLLHLSDVEAIVKGDGLIRTEYVLTKTSGFDNFLSQIFGQAILIK